MSTQGIVRASDEQIALLREYAAQLSVWSAADRHPQALIAVLDDHKRMSDELERYQWQPIETAPKDGTVIDLWMRGEFAGRAADCYWGLPEHCCGEMGSLCDDSEYHSLKEGWVDSSINSVLWHSEEPTHWKPLPTAPLPTEKEA